MYPSSNSHVAPKARNPSKCTSTALAPSAHPPGSETLACPKRATKGPKTNTEARIVFTSS